MRTTLKKSLGEAAAFIDDSHGEPRLLKVLKSLAKAGENLNAEQATIATAVIGRMVVAEPTSLANLWTHIGTTGTSGSTTVQARINGAGQGDGVTTTNAESDGTAKGEVFDPPLELEPGDLVEIEVTAAPGSGAQLTAALRLQPVTLEK